MIEDPSVPNSIGSRRGRSDLWRPRSWLFLSLLGFLVLVTWVITGSPVWRDDTGAPPVEQLTFERIVLSADHIDILVRASGSRPMSIAQVQVDRAYWEFKQEPSGLIQHGNTAWLRLDFPWVQGEAHDVRIVTDTGATFDHMVPVAISTPVVDQASMLLHAKLGILIGVLPIAIGLMLYPVLRNLGRGGVDFLLALTVGLLAYLFVETAGDAIDFASQASPIFQGGSMVILAGAASFVSLMSVARKGRGSDGTRLSTLVAFGIGLHNFGEGLAIGAALASGMAGLGVFLVIGFCLHNVTEGIGIAAPMLRTRPPYWVFPALTFLAGGPAILGLWFGGLAYAPHWSALALAVGAGAILQVILEISIMICRYDRGGLSVLLSPRMVSGCAAGVTAMYMTAMLVKL